MSIEYKIFSSEDWDEFDGIDSFINVVLKVQIGEHPIGTLFQQAYLRL